MGMTNIEHMLLRNCSIQSNLDNEINNLQSLVTLDFNNNDLSGTIPVVLGEVNSLENILLASNDLTGTIPASLASIESLKVLELQLNALTGTVPIEFDSLTDLSLNVTGNSLSAGERRLLSSERL